MKTYFVTGTDTGIGKTFVCSSLLSSAKNLGYSTLGLKPIAAGCEETENGLRNEDALALQKFSTVNLSYKETNPFALKEAIAPHIAAEKEELQLSVKDILVHVKKSTASFANLCVIEGAGGWKVPINETETMADLALALGFPIIFVVGIRLGCINHGMISAESLINDGAEVAGWIANVVEKDMPAEAENVDTLIKNLPFEFLGKIAYSPGLSSEKAPSFPNIHRLL